MATTELDAATREALEGLKFENYIRHFRIEDRRSAQLVPFVLNPVQAKLRAIIDRKLEAGEPVRLIILKSRRMGVSTLIQATYAHLAFTTFRFTARTGAHHHAASSTLHKMTEQMWRFLPDPLRPEKVVGHQGRVLELATESELSTFTAKGGGGDGVGRSMAARAIHASEVAFWDDGAGTMAALKQIVPDEPGTFVIQESTAQGIGDYFHSECLRAMNGESHVRLPRRREEASPARVPRAWRAPDRSDRPSRVQAHDGLDPYCGRREPEGAQHLHGSLVDPGHLRRLRPLARGR
jgi:hypothetical protein